MSSIKSREIPETFYRNRKGKGWKTDVFFPPCEPTKENVDKWCNIWDQTQDYLETETALTKLFTELCPKNEHLNDILIKVCTLNDFYSTNIYKVLDVSRIIKNLKIDNRLKNDERDTGIVTDINEAVQLKTGKSVYSFASKYCSHHKPDLYPIYDYYVDILLRYYRDNDRDTDEEKRFIFADRELKEYGTFCEVEEKFKKRYGLKCGAKQLDKFLWQVGKKHFPRWGKIIQGTDIEEKTNERINDLDCEINVCSNDGHISIKLKKNEKEFSVKELWNDFPYDSLIHVDVSEQDKERIIKRFFDLKEDSFRSVNIKTQ